MGGAEPDGSQWGLNIGGFIAAHRDWLIRGGFDGYGWTAQRRDPRGWARGPVLASLPLMLAVHPGHEPGAATGRNSM